MPIFSDFILHVLKLFRDKVNNTPIYDGAEEEEEHWLKDSEDSCFCYGPGKVNCNADYKTDNLLRTTTGIYVFKIWNHKSNDCGKWL